jgi:hypothetical protein
MIVSWESHDIQRQVKLSACFKCTVLNFSVKFVELFFKEKNTANS